MIAESIAAEYALFPEVEAVALGGSRSTDIASTDADYDLYVYSRTSLPQALRDSVARRHGRRVIETGNEFWEPGDEWIDSSGNHFDVMFRTTSWIEDQLARVLDRHEASVGYSTCFWSNVLHSRILFDRSGWYATLQQRARIEYPEPLRRAIIAKNHPILRTTLSSYRHQIARAVERSDWVSVNHRIAALLASCFDVLFALNRIPHPGEKRQLEWAERTCPLRPPDFNAQVDAVARGKLDSTDPLLDGLDVLLRSEGLLHHTSARLHHVALWTGDLERMRDFYVHYFGATAGPRYDSARRPLSTYFLTFASGAQLELMQIPYIVEPPEPERLGWAHIAISVGSREHVDALTERLAKDGYAVIGQPRVTGDGYYESVVADPEGNSVEITE